MYDVTMPLQRLRVDFTVFTITLSAALSASNRRLPQLFLTSFSLIPLMIKPSFTAQGRDTDVNAAYISYILTF